MKKQLTIAATALAITFVGQINGRTQVIYNSVDLNPSIQTRVDNYMMTHRPGASGYGKSSATAEIESVGNTKIKAGKVSTRFVSSIAGTKMLVSKLDWNGFEQQDVVSQVKFIQRNVKMFNKLAAQNGFITNDAADGYAFAYALSYAAYNDKDMEKGEVEKLRQHWRKRLLSHSYFQGLPDDERQYDYEKNAEMAILAVEQRVKYRQATKAQERREYDVKAKQYANYLLENK